MFLCAYCTARTLDKVTADDASRLDLINIAFGTLRDGLLWYIDYECNSYMEEWSFENWGIRYWSRTPAFEAYLKEQEKHG